MVLPELGAAAPSASHSTLMVLRSRENSSTATRRYCAPQWLDAALAVATLSSALGRGWEGHTTTTQAHDTCYSPETDLRTHGAGGAGRLS